MFKQSQLSQTFARQMSCWFPSSFTQQRRLSSSLVLFSWTSNKELTCFSTTENFSSISSFNRTNSIEFRTISRLQSFTAPLHIVFEVEHDQLFDWHWAGTALKDRKAWHLSMTSLIKNYWLQYTNEQVVQKALLVDKSLNWHLKRREDKRFSIFWRNRASFNNNNNRKWC